MRDRELKAILKTVIQHKNIRGFAFGGDFSLINTSHMYLINNFIIELPENKMIRLYFKIDGYKYDYGAIKSLVEKRFGKNAID
mmetsp:Transcript_36840/g.33076  ORF Transcript_36840/g.33076 Transcript_36840/m.33076 type:complete len:83 (-) Transcript_36840:258-506(-)